MFERIRYTWRVMGASLEVLKKDKELLVFPLLSGLACLIVLASFALPLIGTDGFESWSRSDLGGRISFRGAVSYAVLFLFYFCNYFVITFFNVAVVSSALERLSGGEPTFGSALRAAASRLPQILGWALLAASVGVVLRVIESYSDRLGRLVAGLLGAVWSLATFLVVPVLVVERKGPVNALQRSVALIKKTWGDQVVGGLSFGLVFVLLALPALPFIVLAFVIGGAVSGLATCAVAIVYWVLLALVQSTLQTIFEAAVYFYAERGQAPPLFGQELVAGAIRAH